MAGDIVYLKPDGKITNKVTKNTRCGKCGKFCLTVQLNPGYYISYCCNEQMTQMFKTVAVGRVLSVEENGSGWVRLAP